MVVVRAKEEDLGRFLDEKLFHSICEFAIEVIWFGLVVSG